LNAKRRPRECGAINEVEKLVEGARSRGRYGRRDATMTPRDIAANSLYTNFENFRPPSCPALCRASTRRSRFHPSAKG
jgi:hypothetical protein